jgi:hypothetical protein
MKWLPLLKRYAKTKLTTSKEMEIGLTMMKNS